MGAKQNLKQYLNASNISPAQFYRESGLSNGFLNQGDNISSNNIEIIISLYPDLSLAWLITGNGEMLNTQNNDNKNGNLNGNPNGNLLPKLEEKNVGVNVDASPKMKESNANVLPKSEKNNEEVKYSIKLRKEQLTIPKELLSNKTRTSVPFYDLPVSAGMLGVLESEIFSQSEPDGFLELSAFDGCEAVFPIVGVSMVPIIHSGDWIGIQSIENLSHSWDFIQTDVIYLIITREDRMIKFIDKATDEDFIICRSSNASPFKLFKGDIIKIYRIKACVKRL